MSAEQKAALRRVRSAARAVRDAERMVDARRARLLGELRAGLEDGLSFGELAGATDGLYSKAYVYRITRGQR